MGLSIFSSSLYKEQTREFLHYYDISVINPDLAGLQAILKGFQHLPYENVSKLIRWGSYTEGQSVLFRLPDMVWSDFRKHQLGGTCYSLTYFLETILENLGYEIYPVSCDMKWGENVHCGLVVFIEGESWLCDPGYLLMTPLKLVEKGQSVYRTESSGVKLNWDGSKYHVSTFRGGNDQWRYSFRNRKCERDEFTQYWLESFDRPGMRGLCLTRQEGGNMIYIHNNYIREVEQNEIRKRRVEGNWLREIENYFPIPRSYLEDAWSIVKERRKD